MKRNSDKKDIDQVILDNPWLGLASYQYSDKDRFFGRDKEIEEFSRSIERGTFTVIYGISGAGKSSFIEAGLRPRMASENKYLPISIRLDHTLVKTDSGTALKSSYARQIVTAIKSEMRIQECDWEQITSITDDTVITQSEYLWYYLHTSTIWSKTNHQLTPVIFIDQFEELFTKNLPNYIVEEFFVTIGCLQNNIPPLNLASYLEQSEIHCEFTKGANCKIIISLREDFLARLEDWSSDYEALRNNRVGMKRMNGLQAKKVIQCPKPGLVTDEVAFNIISKVVGHSIRTDEYHLSKLEVDTSLLSLLCSELYIKAAEIDIPEITQELVNNFGANILASFYDRCMAKVSKKTREYLEGQLITRSGFRDSIAYEDAIADGISDKDLYLLADKDTRLIRIEEIDGTARIEYTHDVLCAIAKTQRNTRNQLNEDKRRKIIGCANFVVQVGLLINMLYLYSACYFSSIFTINSIWQLTLLYVLNFLFQTAVFLENRKTAWLHLFITVFNISSICIYDGYELEDVGAIFVVVTLCIFPIIEFFFSLYFDNKYSFKRTLRDVVTLYVFRKYPVLKKMSLFVFLPLVMIILAFFLGMSGYDDIVLYTVPISGITLMIGFAKGNGLALTPSPAVVYPLGAMTIVLLGMMGSQYLTNHFFILLFCFLVLVYSIYYFIRRNGISESGIGVWGLTLYAVVILGIVLPCLSANYNLFDYSLATYARVYKDNVRISREYVLVKIKDNHGYVGLRDAFDIIVPVKFEDVSNRVDVYTPQKSDFGSAIVSLLSLQCNEYRRIEYYKSYSYNEDTDNYYVSIKDEQSGSRDSIVSACSDVVFYPIDKDGNTTMWKISDNLDISNRYSKKIANIYINCDNFEDFGKLVKYYKATYTNQLERLVAKVLLSELRACVVSQYLYGINFSFQKTQDDFDRTVETAHAINKSLAITTSVKESFIDSIKRHPEFGATATYYQTHRLSLKDDSVMNDSAIIHEIRSFKKKLIKPDYDSVIMQAKYGDGIKTGYYCLFDILSENKSLFSLNKEISKFLIDSIIIQYPSLNSNLNLAYYNLFINESEISESFSRKAIREDSTSYIAYTNLVTSLYLQHRYDEALDILNKYKYYSIQGNNSFASFLGRGVLDDIDNLISANVWKDITSEHYAQLMSALADFKPLQDEYQRIVWAPYPPNYKINETGVLVDSKVRGYVRLNDKNVVEIILKPIYSRAWLFSEGLAAVEKDGRIGYINLQGDTVIPFQFVVKNKTSVDLVFHNGYSVMVNEAGLHGLIDKEGKYVIEPQYDFINNPNLINRDDGIFDHYRIVCNHGKYGLLDDRTLKFILPVEFDWICFELGDWKRGAVYFRYSKQEKMRRLSYREFCRILDKGNLEDLY